MTGGHPPLSLKMPVQNKKRVKARNRFVGLDTSKLVNPIFWRFCFLVIFRVTYFVTVSVRTGKGDNPMPVCSSHSTLKTKYFACHIVICIMIIVLADNFSNHAYAQQRTVLVTGSNRGIGLEFVRQYAAKGWSVIATTRRPLQADRLQQLAREHDSIAIELLDVTNGEHLQALKEKYNGRPIDVLINNAGVSGDFQGPGQSFGYLDYTTVGTFMSVNAIGPLRVSEAFYDNVKVGRGKKIIAITALLGVHSFKYGGLDGAYWYKVSKAAMNTAMYNLAREAKKDGVIVTILTPGEVAVEKVENPGSNFIEPALSIRGMIAVISGLTMNDSGAIIRYNGRRYAF